MDNPPAKREFDLIVWGASGFTGRLVVEYLLAHYPPAPSLRWAIAGRNEEKLKQVLSGLATDEAPAIMLGDSDDAASMQRLARSTRVLLSTVGPYAKYGSKLVAACAEGGTHYCDLCGEPQWMRQMIDQYQRTARQHGARIVHSCGFDSIPSDFGVWFLQRHALVQHGQPCREIKLLVKATRGGASGGTLASSLNVLEEARRDRNVARILADPYSLNPEGERQGPDGRDQTGTVFDKQARTWTAPFVMATINTKVVRRSNALLDYAYGRDFRYSESIMTGAGIAGWCKAAGITAAIGAFMLASGNRTTRSLVVERLIPQPGEGPDREQRENGFFNLQLIGTLSNGDLIRARVTGDRDPGYGSTSKMLSESAICLAQDELSVEGGFWTPVSAMGEALLQRLTGNAGLSFSILE